MLLDHGRPVFDDDRFQHDQVQNIGDSELSNMKYRKLGKSNIKVSEIGFGALGYCT